MSKQDREAIASTVGQLLDALDAAPMSDWNNQAEYRKAKDEADKKAKAGLARLVAGFLCDFNRIADAFEAIAAEPAKDPADHDDNQEHLFEGPPS